VKGDDSYFAMLFQRLCSGRQLVLLKWEIGEEERERDDEVNRLGAEGEREYRREWGQGPGLNC
jgi:hypothetical protein